MRAKGLKTTLKREIDKIATDPEVLKNIPKILTDLASDYAIARLEATYDKKTIAKARRLGTKCVDVYTEGYADDHGWDAADDMMAGWSKVDRLQFTIDTMAEYEADGII